jgi:hypothetical protein
MTSQSLGRLEAARQTVAVIASPVVYRGAAVAAAA